MRARHVNRILIDALSNLQVVHCRTLFRPQVRHEFVRWASLFLGSHAFESVGHVGVTNVGSTFVRASLAEPWMAADLQNIVLDFVNAGHDNSILLFALEHVEHLTLLVNLIIVGVNQPTTGDENGHVPVIREAPSDSA